jgi:hypothetical protein
LVKHVYNSPKNGCAQHEQFNLALERKQVLHYPD